MGEPSPGTPPSVRPPEDRLDSWKEIAAYLNRDVTTVQRWEKREGMPVHRHLHDRMGSVYASRAELDAWARSRNLPSSAGERERCPLAQSRRRSRSARRDRPLRSRWTVRRAAGSGGSRAGDWRKPLAPEDGVLLAKPHRRRAIPDRHGLRWGGAGRCGVTRRSLRGVSVGPGRTDGRLGYAGRFGTVPQPDPRERAGARQSIDPHPRVLARWLLRHILGSQTRRPERRRHQHLGGANAGRTAEAIPRRRGRVRLVARRLPARVPHARTRRPAVRVGRQPATRRPAHLHCACRAPLSLSACGRPTRHSSTSSRVPSRTNWTSGASLPTGGTPERITSHDRARESSGPVGSADADVPRQRSRWFGAVALQHGRRAPHSPPADLWPRPVHVAGGQR